MRYVTRVPHRRHRIESKLKQLDLCSLTPPRAGPSTMMAMLAQYRAPATAAAPREVTRAKDEWGAELKSFNRYKAPSTAASSFQATSSSSSGFVAATGSPSTSATATGSMDEGSLRVADAILGDSEDDGDSGSDDQESLWKTSVHGGSKRLLRTPSPSLVSLQASKAVARSSALQLQLEPKPPRRIAEDLEPSSSSQPYRGEWDDLASGTDQLYNFDGKAHSPYELYDFGGRAGDDDGEIEDEVEDEMEVLSGDELSGASDYEADIVLEERETTPVELESTLEWVLIVVNGGGGAGKGRAMP